MRDADQVEAWISTQESFIAGDDYGVSGTHTQRNRHTELHSAQYVSHTTKDL